MSRRPSISRFSIKSPVHFAGCGAYLLDVLISYGGYAVIVILLSLLFSLLLVPLAQNAALQAVLDAISGLFLGMVLVGLFLTTWFYGAFMETYYNGRTLGKMMTGIRVTSVDGSAINAGKATLRNFFRLLDSMPIVNPALVFGVPDVFWPIPLFAVGLVSMTISRKYQRIGDLVAGTIVICEEKEWTHGLAKFEDPRVARLAELIPGDFLVSASMARSLADYVDRRRFLPYQRVAEVAGHLGPRLVEYFGLPSDTNHDLLLCSLYYKTFIDQADENDSGQITAIPSTALKAAQVGQVDEPEIQHEY